MAALRHKGRLIAPGEAHAYSRALEVGGILEQIGAPADRLVSVDTSSSPIPVLIQGLTFPIQALRVKGLAPNSKLECKCGI